MVGTVTTPPLALFGRQSRCTGEDQGERERERGREVAIVQNDALLSDYENGANRQGVFPKVDIKFIIRLPVPIPSLALSLSFASFSLCSLSLACLSILSLPVSGIYAIGAASVSPTTTLFDIVMLIVTYGSHCHLHV